MNKNSIYILLFGLVLGLKIAVAQENELEQKPTTSDSLLETYSIEDLLEYRNLYHDQIDKIEKERIKLREKGIKDAEHFLKNNPDSKILDKIIMRLAELYYQKANDDFLDAMEKYDESIEAQEKKHVDDSLLVEPKKNYDVSLSLYQRIIDEFPQSNLLDDAIYHKAFLFEELGRSAEALTIYQNLISDFPSSRYVPEALMRIAEYYFNPPNNNIQQAIEYYKQILDYKASRKYDEALYRLGWCYYKLSDYPEAVAYFTLLADDIERAKNLDPSQKVTNPALRDESIEYIGISFLDYGGAENAWEYIKSIGGREYGVEILKKIGDVYKDEKEDYSKAIETYNLLLKMYPNYSRAPEIQEKIVDCHRFMQDDMLAYLARNKLYGEYKPGSPWWQNNDNETLREKAIQITERALRDNINLLYQKAEATNDFNLYLQAVNDSKKYLKSFPADSNALLIHWNVAVTLDTKLKDYEQAYDEYMKICDLYWGSKHQKNAAKNAIALAKDAVALDTTKKKIEFVSQAMPENQKLPSVLYAITYNIIELTESEKKLARAYDNYIKIFPHESETVDILNDAGALYYNNNQFTDALKYYNTLVKHFPNSEHVNYAKFTIMESYFGKHDFRSTEIVARKLKNTPGANSDLVKKAKNRLAQSIFLSAQVFADSANHLAAGNEFIRVVLEVPDADFADLSLFNASLQYDAAKEYRRAVETYNYLIESKPNSKFLLDAMNNLALDYGELAEFKNAALTYEKLAYTTKDSVKAYDALYNSSIFFVKGEEWKDAIRINRTFIKKYPTSKDAEDLFFDIATYYLKLDDLDNANIVYGEYVQAYPNSARVVETYFHRGEYYRKKNEIDKAIEEYNKAIAKNEDFKKKKVESNDFFAAEALFNLTRLKYDEYSQIEFVLPNTKMQQDKEKKKQLLKALIEGFSRVTSYGTLRLYEATYYIGDSYEEFAEAWARQEIAPMDETRKIVMQKEINQAAAELYGHAEKSYKQAVKVLTKLAEQYESELVKSDTFAVADDKRLKIVTEDSTLRVARTWIERCKEKISEVIYDAAELNLNTVNSFLSAPIPPGLDRVAEMEYRRQVLNRAVEPLINEIIDAHSRNIKDSWELGLENQWVKLSRSKIISTNNILSNEYEKLAITALQLYRNNSQKYAMAIEQSAKVSEEFDAITISEQMANFIDFGKVFATVSLEIGQNTLEKANTEGISDPIVAVTKEKIMQTVYEFTQRCDSLIAETATLRKKFENLYKEKNMPEFEEALFTYEDNYLSFKEYMKVLLEAGFQTSKELNIKNKWTTKILISLVRLDPEQYCNLLDLTIDSKNIYTDASWLATDHYDNGWTSIDYNDSFWGSARVINGNDFRQPNEATRIWYMEVDTLTAKADSTTGISSITDTTNLDSTNNSKRLVTTETKIKEKPSKRVFFRKNFFIEGLPVSAELKLVADDSYNLFLNGEYIHAFDADAAEWKNEKLHRLDDFLRPQANVLAIEVRDSDLSGGGFQGVLSIKNIPDWESKRQKYEIETSDEKIKQNLVMDKYIIIN